MLKWKLNCDAALLVCCLYDEVNCQAILDAMLAEAVSILQDLPRKNQNQLVLFGFESPRDLFFKLNDSKKWRGMRKVIEQQEGELKNKQEMECISVLLQLPSGQF